jgi:hypothetical protein
MDSKKSTIQCQEISKASGYALNVTDVCYLNIENTTGFEVIVKDKHAGAIRVRAGKNVQYFAFDCPFDFNATVTFNNAAPNTDFITFHVTSQNNGSKIKQC